MGAKNADNSCYSMRYRVDDPSETYFYNHLFLASENSENPYNDDTIIFLPPWANLVIEPSVHGVHTFLKCEEPVCYICSLINKLTSMSSTDTSI